MLTHPASTTRHGVPRDVRLASGITDGLVRLAVGLADVKDITAESMPYGRCSCRLCT